MYRMLEQACLEELTIFN